MALLNSYTVTTSISAVFTAEGRVRKGIDISNMSGSTVYISLSSSFTAAPGAGVYVLPQYASITLPTEYLPDVTTNVVYARTASTTAVVNVVGY